METALIAAVFAAASQATAWTTTNLGPRTEVNHDGYTWTVQLPAEGQGVARIVGRDGYGGPEFLDTPATPALTADITKAATAALHPTGAPAGSWEVEEDGITLASNLSVAAAKAHATTLILSGRVNPEQLAVDWVCAVCEGLGECPTCEAGRTGQLMAYVDAEGVGRYATSYIIRPAD